MKTINVVGYGFRSLWRKQNFFVWNFCNIIHRAFWNFKQSFSRYFNMNLFIRCCLSTVPRFTAMMTILRSGRSEVWVTLRCSTILPETPTGCSCVESKYSRFDSLFLVGFSHNECGPWIKNKFLCLLSYVGLGLEDARNSKRSNKGPSEICWLVRKFDKRESTCLGPRRCGGVLGFFAFSEVTLV